MNLEDLLVNLIEFGMEKEIKFERFWVGSIPDIDGGDEMHYEKQPENG